MELNWSTFVLEIINFLVLIWILKHFFYKPVRDVIARRQAGIEARLAEAQRLQEEAEKRRAEYENRLSDWEQERQRARDALAQELEGERARQLAALQASLAEEREKARVAEEHRQAEIRRELERQALQQGAKFAARLLGLAAGPELQSRLLHLLVEELKRLSPAQRSAIAEQWKDDHEAVLITSAFPLDDTQKQQLQTVLTELGGRQRTFDYRIDPDLQAGVRITAGAWLLQANVRDELEAFAGFANAN